MSFAIITNSTTISATELNNNFYHIGQGDLLPMGGVSLTAETGQHNLGSSGNQWRSIYVNEIAGTLTVSAPMTFNAPVTFNTTTSFPSGFLGYFPYILAYEMYATGTNGPVGTTGAYAARALNTSSTYNLSATLTSNQVTLPPGTYEVEAWASGVGIVSTSPFRARLYNITDGTVTAQGQNACGAGPSTSYFCTAHSIIYSQFTIAGTTTFELQCRQASSATNSGEGNTQGRGIFACFQAVRIA